MIHGITYDTGFEPGGRLSREVFDPAVVEREMRVIARELHCAAVRVTGGDPRRLSVAARAAAAEGLAVWYSPFPCELGPDELRPYFAGCAREAAQLRRTGADVTLVTGCELSLFAAGILPGATVYDRMNALMTGQVGDLPQALARFGAVLADAARDARAEFDGPISYASGPWEQVDWALFDIVAVDAYRDAGNAARYADDLRSRRVPGKPLVVSEFGCCTYVGAADKGGLGWAIQEPGSQPPRLNGEYTRSEQEQVDYLRTCLPVFEELGVDAAFWFTFASYRNPYHPDPRYDLDMGAYGVVKMLDEVRWEPKAVFHALADAYG
jgi:hypothetical protein